MIEDVEPVGESLVQQAQAGLRLSIRISKSGVMSSRRTSVQRDTETWKSSEKPVR
jgi:hypothetical protein